MNTINLRFKKQLNQVFTVSPNDLHFGLLTHVYKIITPFLKTMPFIIIIPLSILIVFIAYFVFGALTVRLTSLLQYGF